MRNESTRSEPMKFRRATHTREGVYVGPTSFEERNRDCGDGAIWHWLESGRAMSFDDLLADIKADDTNWEDKPLPEQVALWVIRGIEAGTIAVETEVSP